MVTRSVVKSVLDVEPTGMPSSAGRVLSAVTGGSPSMDMEALWP